LCCPFHRCAKPSCTSCSNRRCDARRTRCSAKGSACVIADSRLPPFPRLTSSSICAPRLCCFLFRQKLAGASLLIFANKQDLAGALSQEEIARVLDLSTLGDTGRHWRIVGCSAWTGDGLIDGVDWIVNDIAGRIYMMD